MRRVCRLVALPVLVACALLAFEIPAPSPDLWSGLRIRIEALDRGPADGQSAPRGPIRRVSQSGYSYGMCDGVISAVLLSPEPCRELWRERLSLLARAQD